MPYQDLLLAVARQRMHDDEHAAARHRLTRKRLKAFSGLLKLDWQVVREQRRVVASVGFSWQRSAG
ncbi:hypothetical protein ACQPZF_07640 [Actinosynnema sp. CS-041913]|uniref:hypothetical protein n=1 Tax=Actinosynnema sp. CS-041913 TaxID=3239917 RepID=UPI003D94BB49